jgi:hypothetical protein
LNTQKTQELPPALGNGKMFYSPLVKGEIKGSVGGASWGQP